MGFASLGLPETGVFSAASLGHRGHSAFGGGFFSDINDQLGLEASNQPGLKGE